KLPGDVLSRSVLRYRGRGRGDVILWPKYGEDAGAVKLGGETLVIASDPITGSKNLVGWLAVHINANDVAVCGAKPTWMSSCILLPKGSKAEDFRNIASQIDRAARSIDVAVITGHSEIAPHTSSPIVVGTMTGRLVSKRLITSSGAKPGDYIVMSKTAGLEGTAILSTDFSKILEEKGIHPATIKKASRYYSKISIVKEALQLAKSGLATAMHDPTEGGVIGGLYELCSASGCGFEIHVDKIPVSREVRLICDALDIDPLRLISSGVLLASVRKPPKSREFKLIGRVTKRKEGMRIISKTGETRIKNPPADELWRILNLYGR
ncbi:MAG TPA: hypothetical protein EYP20_03720, partial [Aigarchaeota archaeon]|nr:hypothetical protein [Aigarchaeota archaeon]